MFGTLLLIGIVAAATVIIDVHGPAHGNVPVRHTHDDTIIKYNTPILDDDNFKESILAINRERLPERVVHAKGTGAFGYFEVTRDISHICEADFLKKVGKKTPVVVRFSTGSGDRGSSDFPLDSRGLSIRFYTEEGNFDILGFHTEMYFYKDPHHFNTIVHGVRKRPHNNLMDINTFWDSALLVPESMNFFTRILSHEGIPASYMNMPGHSIHTYPVVNKHGDYHFVRFHFMPDAGVKTLTVTEAAILTATDPDKSIKGLYNSINNGVYPSWTVSVQILTRDDVKRMGPRAFDVTRLIPRHKFPFYKIGKIVLNRNANDFKKEIEMLALCPCNLIPGIYGPPDKIFESRIIAYSDTQMYRLGVNRNKYPVNCPLRTIFTYNRDGVFPVGKNDGNATNYYPTSFNGPQPYDMPKDRNEKCKASGLFQIEEIQGADNFDQVVDFYNSLTEERKATLIGNIKAHMLIVKDFIRERACNMFTAIHPDFGNRLVRAINNQ